MERIYNDNAHSLIIIHMETNEIALGLICENCVETGEPRGNQNGCKENMGKFTQWEKLTRIEAGALELWCTMLPTVPS